MDLQHTLSLIGSPLAEGQLWALAYQLLKFFNSHEAARPEQDAAETQHGPVPRILGLQSVVIEDDGSARIVDVPETATSSQFLPDEVAQSDDHRTDELDEEKVHMFGLGALLFTAADFSLSDDEEPELSQEMETFLGDLTEEDPTLQLTAAEALARATRHQDASQMAAADELISLLQLARTVAQTQAQNDDDAETAHASGTASPQPPSDDLHAKLMTELKAPPSLRKSTERSLDGPEPYVTPRERLLREIEDTVPKAAWHELNGKPASLEAEQFQTTSSVPLSVAKQLPAHCSSASLLSSSGTKQSSNPPSKAGDARKVTKLSLSVSDIGDILGGWDPTTQVTMAFEAEQTKEQETLKAQPDAFDKNALSEEKPAESLSVSPKAGQGSNGSSQGDSSPASHGTDHEEHEEEDEPVEHVLFSDLSHINSTLFKAELDNMQDEDPPTYDLIVRDKLCSCCFETRFNVISRGKNCRICDRLVCKKCFTMMRLPPHMFRQRSASSSSSPKSVRSRSGSGVVEPTTPSGQPPPGTPQGSDGGNKMGSFSLRAASLFQRSGSQPGTPRTPGRSGHHVFGVDSASPDPSSGQPIVICTLCKGNLGGVQQRASPHRPSAGKRPR